MDNNYITYITTDTAIAAWLQLNGLQLLKVDNDGFPSSFVFTDPQWSAAALAEDFYLGKAEGNVFQFFRIYRKLIATVKHNSS